MNRSSFLPQSARVVQSVLLLALANCSKESCNLDQVKSLIYSDIQREGSNQRDFRMQPPRKEGSLIYVGMAQRLNEFYHWHYWIDPKTCKIVDVMFDQ